MRPEMSRYNPDSCQAAKNPPAKLEQRTLFAATAFVLAAMNTAMPMDSALADLRLLRLLAR